MHAVVPIIFIGNEPNLFPSLLQLMEATDSSRKVLQVAEFAGLRFFYHHPVLIGFAHSHLGPCSNASHCPSGDNCGLVS